MRRKSYKDRDSYLDADCEALLIKKCCCDRKSEKEFVSLLQRIKL